MRSYVVNFCRLGVENYYSLLAFVLKNNYIILQRCLAVLDPGAAEALTDVITKVLRKVALQPEGKVDELDDTLLT